MTLFNFSINILLNTILINLYPLLYPNLYSILMDELKFALPGGIALENSIKEILNGLNGGKIKYEDAIKSIKGIHCKTKKIKKKPTGIKISVIDEKHSINLPKLPFGLISLLIDIGFGLSSIAIRLIDDLDEDTKKILDSIDKKDIKEIIKVVKKCGPFDLIDIEQGDSTKVKISVL